MVLLETVCGGLHLPGLNLRRLLKEGIMPFMSEGSADKTPKLKSGRGRPARSNEELLATYREEYHGVAPNVLRRIGYALHRTLTRRKLFKVEIAGYGNTDWGKYTDEELIAYHAEHYPGLCGRALEKQDQRFYGALKRRGLLGEIVKPRPSSPIRNAGREKRALELGLPPDASWDEIRRVAWRPYHDTKRTHSTAQNGSEEEEES